VRHLLAKDILKFHAVIWPAFLMAAEIPVPRQLFIHGYLLIDDRKMSKSLGNVIDPLDLIEVYGVDPLRFFLLRSTPFGQDGSVSISGLHERYERELGNELGNLLSRTTAMIARYRDGRLTATAGTPELAEAVDALGAGALARFDEFDITGALELTWELVRGLNRHVEQTKPWELAKDDARGADLDRVLYDLADGLRAVAIALASVLPETAPRILEALGQPGSVSWDLVAAGAAQAVDGIVPAEPLFPRVESPVG
jgi:methionyl-tRNA synthetase